jgi:hypothetical protein
MNVQRVNDVRKIHAAEKVEPGPRPSEVETTIATKKKV